MAPTSEQIADMATRIQLGLLRPDEPDECWGGLGNGWTCDGCGRPITSSELEIEADFDEGTTTLHFHVSCFLAWHRATEAARAVAI